MNVLHVESSLNWGGQEERTVCEAHWLNRNGHRCWVACNPTSEIKRRSGRMAVALDLKRSFAPSSSVKLARLCRRRSVDVLHVHSPKDAWICVPLHLLGLPVVRSRQITNAVKACWSRSVIYRRGCSQLITTADCIRRELVARNGVSPERVTVIGEGVDLSRFHPGIDGRGFRREFGIRDGEILFGLVAMIRPEKGHLTFIDAARITHERHAHTRFVIVGEGTGARELEFSLRRELVRRQGGIRSGPVIMTGFREDIPEVIAALDALVVPSHAEAQSLVIPQAFASAKPVIASAVGGIPELVDDGRNGLLTPPGDAIGLAEAMERFVTDPQLRKRLSEAGLRHARTHLDFGSRMAETISVYRKAARPPAARKRDRDGGRDRARGRRSPSIIFTVPRTGFAALACLVVLLIGPSEQTGAGLGHSAAGPVRRWSHLWSGYRIHAEDLNTTDPTEIPPPIDDDDDVLT